MSLGACSFFDLPVHCCVLVSLLVSQGRLKKDEDQKQRVHDNENLHGKLAGRFMVLDDSLWWPLQECPPRDFVRATSMSSGSHLKKNVAANRNFGHPSKTPLCNLSQRIGTVFSEWLGSKKLKRKTTSVSFHTAVVLENVPQFLP